MKYFVLLCDGAADRKISKLGDKTPLEAAVKPTFNMLSYRSFNGLTANSSKNYPADPYAGFLSVCSYDPDAIPGFAAIDALSAGVGLTEEDTVFRCSFVTLSDEEEYTDKRITGLGEDITPEETSALIRALNKGVCGSSKLKKFCPVSDNGCCFVWKRASETAGACSPYGIKGERTGDHLQAGKLQPILKKSYEVLNDHPVNVKRREEGKSPLNSIWLWSAGKKPEFEPFDEKWRTSSAVITDSGVVAGIAGCAGMKVIDVPAADGAEDLDKKAQAATDEFSAGTEFVLLHVSSVAKRSLEGDAQGKAEAIQDADSRVLAPVYEYLCGCGDQFKLLVSTGMPAPCEDRAYSSEELSPFFMYNSQRTEVGYKPFSENNAKKSGFCLPEGFRFLSFMIRLPAPVKEETQEENGQQQLQ